MQWKYFKENKIKKLFKIKELSQIVLRKGLFVWIKEHLWLKTGYLANLEGQVETKFTYVEDN